MPFWALPLHLRAVAQTLSCVEEPAIKPASTTETIEIINSIVKT
jgi:hypothetical protein